ncbi:unnamed protein product [Rotaria magnacalcarata]|nr:unnamed protein product [Rotaria magnacalcarata]CAF1941989.1 unnamed protein product [Rotaria magnacalcarata]
MKLQVIYSNRYYYYHHHHRFLDVTHHHGLPDSPVLVTAEENQNGQTRDDISSNIDCNENNDLHVESRLPTDYTGSILTTRIQYYIDQNSLSKFNPHTTLRGEILSLLFDDVTKTYNLLQVILVDNICHIYVFI